MAKPEWGLKRICHSCGTRYYDMGRAEIHCPKCGTEFDPEALLKSRRGRPASTAGIPAPAAAEITMVDEDAPAADEEKGDEEEELIEDTSELGEDEDDVAEVIEKVDEDEER